MNIAIYGAGISGKIVLERIDKYLGGNNILVYFVETNKTKEKHCGHSVKGLLEIKPDEFDALIVAVPDMYELMKESLILHPQCDLIKKKIRFLSQIEILFHDMYAESMPYRSVQIDSSLTFLASSTDYTIGESMYMYKKCFAEDQVKRFFELMRYYCGFEESSNGIFFDIGANIGTTSIYAKKKLAPSLRYIGFEAGLDNYKLCKANCIINEVEDIVVEYLALGEKSGKGCYYYNQFNSGGSGVSYGGDSTEEIAIMSLDEYMIQNHIGKEKVSCIWLDTEGFEAEILLGGRALIESKRIPLMQEFNPAVYESKGKEKEYYALMEQCYEHFIDMDDVEKNHKISVLSEYRNVLLQNGKRATDLFFF